jgi:DNA-binding beta-propeller fold protein YncE
MKKIELSFYAIILILIAASCKKTDVQPTTPGSTDSAGIYVLGEGNFGVQNATTISSYIFGDVTAVTDTFYNKNHFNLGSTGDDFIVYGGKMYIAMNSSGYVAVVNASNVQFIDSISFIIADTNRAPENIIAYQNHIFVTCNTGAVAVIDTQSLSITKFIPVGNNPAQMAISGTNLYVSNTGGYATPPDDSTLSVINLNTLTETLPRIIVGLNPGYIAADNSGNLFVACTGDYNTVLPKLVEVSTSTNTITQSSPVAAGVVRYYNNQLYITGGYLGTATVQVLNPANLNATPTSFTTDGTVFADPNGLDIDPATGNVYVCDAIGSTSGEIYGFNNSGKKTFSFAEPTAFPIKVVLKP